MNIPFVRRRRRTTEELEMLRQADSRGLSRVLAMLGLIFLVLESFLAIMLILPAWLEWQELAFDREYTEQALQRAQQEEEEAHNRFLWMMDPEYFEQIARDRANQAKAGEKVIRRARSVNHAARQDTPAHPKNSAR